MRTIGLLGGMSWESSLQWYRLANEAVRRERGGFHSAPILLDSLDFATIEAMQEAGDWDAAGDLLADHASRLEAAGAEVLALCTNTMHLVADRIEAAVSVPLVHIVDVTAAAATAVGSSAPGLLGTAFTMEQPFYRERLERHGLEVVVPESDDRATVHRVIYDELVRGVVTDASRAAYRDVIGRLVDRGADSIVLGCTEIELLVSQDDSPVPVLPTTALHVVATLRAAGR